MNKNLLKEIKYRIFLICLNWFVLTNVLYYYKEILLFIIFKQLNYLNDIDFYLVYTNITELFTIYLNLINFCTSQVSFLFIIYHILVFCLPTLYKNEFYFLVHLFILFLGLNLGNVVCFSVILNIIITFLKEFQEPYVYFELKVTEIFHFLLHIFLRFQFITNCLVLTLTYWGIKLFRHFSYFVVVLFFVFYCIGAFNTYYIIECIILVLSYEFIFFLDILLKQKVLYK